MCMHSIEKEQCWNNERLFILTFSCHCIFLFKQEDSNCLPKMEKWKDRPNFLDTLTQ